MSQDLFEELQEQEYQGDTEGVETQDAEQAVDVDTVKLRRKNLLAGKEMLTEEDFGDDVQAYTNYRSQVEQVQEYAKTIPGKAGENMFRAFLQGLHKGEFRKYVPGGRPKRTPREYVPKIPELARFNEIMRKAHEAFEEWKKGQTFEIELANYINELGLEVEDVPELTVYWNGANAIKKAIKQKFS